MPSDSVLRFKYKISVSDYTKMTVLNDELSVTAMILMRSNSHDNNSLWNFSSSTNRRHLRWQFNFHIVICRGGGIERDLSRCSDFKVWPDFRDGLQFQGGHNNCRTASLVYRDRFQRQVSLKGCSQTIREKLNHWEDILYSSVRQQRANEIL